MINFHLKKPNTKLWQQFRIGIMLALSLMIALPPAVLYAWSPNDLSSYQAKYPWYNPNDVGCGGTGVTADSTLSGNDNLQKAFNYFVNTAHYSVQLAAALVGNIGAESHGDPTADNGTHHGIAQWGGGRLTGPQGLIATAARSTPPQDPNSLAFQLSFIVTEGSGPYKSVFDAASAAPGVAGGPGSATYIINNQYEVSGNAAEAKREGIAQDFFNKNGGVSAAGASTTTGSTSLCNTVSTGSCTNPIPDPIWKSSVGRTDDGVDYNVSRDTPVLAICDMNIIGVDKNAGWPGPGGGDTGGSFIYAKLTSGPLTGKCWYYTENLRKSDLPSPGAHIPAGQYVATLMPGYPGIEMGFAKEQNLAAMRVGKGNYPAESGKAAARFLRSLGAPTREDPGPGPAYAGESCP